MAARARRRVWFNKSFSSIYNVIRLLREADAPGDFHIVCSHTNPQFVAYEPSHETEVESATLSEEEYVRYCLDFCERRKIEVFSPGRSRFAIADARAEFEARGVRMLLAAEADTLRLFEDKAAFCAGLDPAVGLSPRFIKVNTAAEFLEACETLRADGAKLCFKPSKSTGGLGFRILDDGRTDVRNLLGGEYLRMTTSLAAHILGQEERFRDLLVMEYLDGPEYSVDCLADKGRLLRAIPRRKATTLGGAQLLENNRDLIALAGRIAEAYKLDSIFNVQVRYTGDVPKILEINARMSGGIYFACLSGVNLPGWAIALACGDATEADIPQPQFGRLVHQQYHEFIYDCEAAPAAP